MICFVIDQISQFKQKSVFHSCSSCTHLCITSLFNFDLHVNASLHQVLLALTSKSSDSRYSAPQRGCAGEAIFRSAVWEKLTSIKIVFVVFQWGKKSAVLCLVGVQLFKLLEFSVDGEQFLSFKRLWNALQELLLTI